MRLLLALAALLLLAPPAAAQSPIAGGGSFNDAPVLAATLESNRKQVERALVEQRHYQRRRVLGGPHLRGLLFTMGARQPLVAYLPVAVADELPLSARFRVRLIAALHLAVDPREVEPAALQVAALGRVVQVRRAH